jgi:hypothetical protein
MGGSFWLALLLTKYVGIFVLCAGIGGALLGGARAQRQWAAYWVATAGFVLTATAGFGMAKATGAKLGAPWIAGSLLLALAALDLTIRSVEPGRSRSVARMLGIAGALAAALVLMIWQPGAA